MGEQRKLAAIMFSDIAGYSAMMLKDEKRGYSISTIPLFINPKKIIIHAPPLTPPPAGGENRAYQLFTWHGAPPFPPEAERRGRGMRCIAKRGDEG